MKQMQFEDVSPDYQQFVDKFKLRKTTDDCYTPAAIYETVLNWAAAKYNFALADVVRPFWPGGDYERFDYPANCVVVDNPPFSILHYILKFYNARGIRYFLFAPALTLFAGRDRCNCVVTGNIITYENGAQVATGFVTSMGEYRVECAPDLFARINAANKQSKPCAKERPKYDYPPDVVTAARLQVLVRAGVEFKVRAEDCVFIRGMDAQRGQKKEIFGGGFLLSKAAAAKMAAAKAAAAKRAIVWELSEREKALQDLLSRNA